MSNLIGYGIDHHALIKKDGFNTLGGIKFASHYQIVAHSDGDLVYHALANAILSALQFDDIGTYFKDTDPKNKNLNSYEILQFALTKMTEANYQLNNVCVILESDFIYISPLKQEILQNLKKILKINLISLHANRNELQWLRISCYVTISLIKTRI